MKRKVKENLINFESENPIESEFKIQQIDVAKKILDIKSPKKNN